MKIPPVVAFLLTRTLLLCSSVRVPVAAANNNATLTLLSGIPTSKCLDGSSSGFYYKPATSSGGKTKWIFMLEGGGCARTSRTAKAVQRPTWEARTHGRRPSTSTPFQSPHRTHPTPLQGGTMSICRTATGACGRASAPPHRTRRLGCTSAATTTLRQR